jgi:thiol:disulfide interchange protein DsbD
MRPIKHLATILGLAVLLYVGAAGAAAPANAVDAILDQARSARSNDDFLPPDQAFRFDATADGADRIRLTWSIAPGYYLYRDRIKVSTDDPAIQLTALEFPSGIVKQDEYFGQQVIYHGSLMVPFTATRAGSAVAAVKLHVTYQGCAEAGLCYPPQNRDITLRLPGAGATLDTTAAHTAARAASTAAGGTRIVGASYVSQQDRLAQLLRTGNLLTVLFWFFTGGLALAFTPCVLPMVPILSGLIVGAGERMTTSRAFLLSLTYVLGMAVTYTVTGALAALAGKQVQALFQQTWIIVAFAAIFVTMALSMFGLYTVQMPSFIQTRVSELSNRQRGGNFGGVAIMGALSALIVTTCVGPVLVAALVVIGQTGDIARGASALFAMGLGMGTPLLVVGSSAGRWLPRAGAWMDSVKRLFGALMLALAAWMLERIVPARWSLLLFAVPAAAAAAVLWSFVPAGSRASRIPLWTARTASLLAAAYGIALLVGAARGSDDWLDPLAAHAASEAEPSFIAVTSLTDLQHEVSKASAAHQPVMLDFYADWCTSCKEMQRFTFADPQVREALKHVLLLRADVTANSAADRALLSQFQIYGPPTIAFYDSQGREHPEYRVIGYMKAAEFAALLHRALASGSG